MATIKETFNGAISEAIKNAELISDSYQKAMVYASVAQALAQSGLLVNGDTVEVVAKTKTEAKAEKKESKPKKTADTLKRQPETIPEEEPVKEPEEASVEEVPAENSKDWTEEWTDEAIEFFNDELNYITEFVDHWGEESANECLAEYSNGSLKDISADINPLNIKAIVLAFKQLEAAA